MSQKLIVAMTMQQGREYAEELGFNNPPIMTPDHTPVGVRADEIWIVGEMVKYYNMIINMRIILKPEAIIYKQSEFPNRSN